MRNTKRIAYTRESLSVIYEQTSRARKQNVWNLFRSSAVTVNARELGCLRRGTYVPQCAACSAEKGDHNLIIQVDSREKPKAISNILTTFDRNNIKYFVSKLPVGDYMTLYNARLVIDRKQNLSELCTHVCQQHERFKAELLRANELGIVLIVLCEHGGSIRSMSDVLTWQNPRLKIHPYAMSGKRLHSVLSTISSKYKVQFEFCDKRQTGKRIIELLEGGINGSV